jgi:hypothetical protein
MMAAKTSGFSLLLSDVCYALSRNRLISLPAVTGPFDRVWFEQLVPSVQE